LLNTAFAMAILDLISHMMPEIIENLWTRHIIARERLYYMLCFSPCVPTQWI